MLNTKHQGTMLKHKLRTLILRILAEQPCTGYGLIKRIEEQTRWRPSYGSVYPTLDKMRAEGLLAVKQEGRKKRYSLTEEGRSSYHVLKERHRELFQNAREHIKLIAHMLGFNSKQLDEFTDLFFSAVEKGETPFAEIMKSSTELKLVCWDLYKKGLLKKKKKAINDIISGATNQLRALANEHETPIRPINRKHERAS
ncbi:PadR family transcriptional regulator [Candidatus Woesearchaeota archaeon]|nr:MAG: PadR family transcriptional regulator [Candidatus Woesearchaeota archaeon]